MHERPKSDSPATSVTPKSSEASSSSGGGNANAAVKNALRTSGSFDEQVQMLTPSGQAPVQKKDTGEDTTGDKKDEGASSTPTPSVPRVEAVFQAITAEMVAQAPGEGVSQHVAPLLAEYTRNVHYNNVEEAGQLVDHIGAKRQEKADTTAQEAFADFTPDSTAPLAKVSGAQCVGQGLDIARRVNEQGPFHAYPVAAQFPNREPQRIHTHGAAMIAFANPADEDDQGYVLLDPGFNLSAPVVVRKQLPAAVRSLIYKVEKVDDGENVFSENAPPKSSSDGASSSTTPAPSRIATFPADKQVMNGEAAISKMALLTFQTFNIVNRAGAARRYVSINLRANEFKLVFANPTSKKAKEVTVDTADLPVAKEQIAALVDADVATTFGYATPEELLAALFKILDARKDILSLQDSNIGA